MLVNINEILLFCQYILIFYLFFYSKRSVRVNFQYAVDILCGSLNRQCDIRKIFDYIGVKNDQSPAKIDFVFINDTYYDPRAKRTFIPSTAKMFACDEPVILPHLSKEKCTCMDCNAMCPKINNTKTVTLITKNSTFHEKLKSKLLNLHIVTVIAIGLYSVFVLMFFIACFILCICNVRDKQTNQIVESKKMKRNKRLEILHLIIRYTNCRCSWKGRRSKESQWR